MDKIKRLVRSLRQENAINRRFVPELALKRFMTEDTILEALAIADVKKHQHQEIATKILQSGCKIFAILILTDQVNEVLKFIRADELQDTRLPFKASTLEEIGVLHTDEFAESQWEFTAPIFVRGTLHRKLRKEIIVPFITRDPEGRGGFGRVFRVQLPLDHRSGGDDCFPLEFVQKEMDDEESHQKELENLAILNHLKHPNIVELLASYSHGNTHNLLFPRAECGSLASLLQTTPNGTPCQSYDSFLIALAGLSSAIGHVHNFFERKIDLQLIGCHHDLRPHNILVTSTKFVLADFGISRFKDSLQNSETPFREGFGDYLAPECEDVDTFEYGRVRRSSDIWSFGCIVLEAAVYMAYGHTVVDQFRDERRSVVRGFECHRFHDGSNQPSEAVNVWSSKLKERSRSSERMLVVLTRKMLNLEESERPTASEVNIRIQVIALSELATTISTLFDNLATKIHSFDISIERARFSAWKYATRIMPLEDDPSLLWTVEYETCPQYDSVLACLMLFREQLEWRLSQVEEDVNLDYSQIRELNDRLGGLLPFEQQEMLRNYFRIVFTSTAGNMLSHHDDDAAASGLLIDHDIRLGAVIRNMTMLTTRDDWTGNNQGLIDSSVIRVLDRFGQHFLGRMRSEDQELPVLIEWRPYVDYGADANLSGQHYARLREIYRQMSTEKPVSMRALNCKGYLHDTSRHAFGLVFQIPRPMSVQADHQNYFTLQKWIADTTSKEKSWPVLDDRFRLANTLARSILSFHLSGWLHRNLSAPNVAFFADRGTSQMERVVDPYIIGFHHSRPNDPASFTSRIGSPELIGYQHPEYRRKGRGYRPEHDYYSLGVILMEIGHWRPLKEIAGVTGTYGEENDRKLRDRIGRLKQNMGRNYWKAVSACIHGEFPSTKTAQSGPDDKGLFIDFETNVLSCLRRTL